MKKRILVAICVTLVVIFSAAAVLFSGLLVTPTKSSLDKDTPVQSRDILALQFQREQQILTDYASSTYTLQKPYIIQDPYQANPLSAIILFETQQPAQAELVVVGKDQYSTFSYTDGGYRTHHELAVLGLYPAYKNQVSITLTYQNGQKETSSQAIQTEPLPDDFPAIKVNVSRPGEMEPGVDLMTACLDSNYTYLIDANGDVRGYFSNKNFGHCTAMTILNNGRLLATGDVMKLMPYNMSNLWEMNLLGKVFVEYEVPNAVHHDVIELSNGDFLAVSNNPNMPLGYDTREDVIIRIDRQTGTVEQSYDLRQILDEHRLPYNHYGTGIQNTTNQDWAHLNSVEVDDQETSILTSSPIQSALVKFDAATLQIDWILSSPQGWDGQFSKYQPYLLTPVGDNFEWQWGQHSARILPDSDGDPNTIDILLFDNGQARSFTQANSMKPEENYSRAVIYRINETDRTVEQLWQFGKELGSSAYSTFLGNAELLSQTGNINIDFGGMLRKDGIPVDDIVSGVIGQQEIQSRVTEVKPNGEITFDISITPHHSSDAETYQVHKIDLYTDGVQYALAQSMGQRLGNMQPAPQVSYNLPKFFIPTLTLNFKQLYEKNNYLIAQGSFLYQDQSYLLGKVIFVLKNRDHTYIFSSNPGINGNFAAQIDLSQLAPGEYAIYTVGGVVDGTDALGKIKPGYVATGYKITVK
jgi:arylsulfate sulfotransferase